MTDTVESTLETEPPAVPASPPRSARTGVPFLPAIFLGVALLVLGFAVGTWWTNREATPSAVDIGFYDDMSTHHLQAIRMANIFQRNGDDDGIRARAEEIAYFQAGDVREMQNALSDWNETGSPDTAMEWMGTPVPQGEQPGMATPEELAELQAARGLELDDLFTRLMIDHHAGGIHMAEYAEEHARLEDVRDLARAIVANQEMEIGELNHVRQNLGLSVHEPAG